MPTRGIVLCLWNLNIIPDQLSDWCLNMILADLNTNRKIVPDCSQARLSLFLLVDFLFNALWSYKEERLQTRWGWNRYKRCPCGQYADICNSWCRMQRNQFSLLIHLKSTQSKIVTFSLTFYRFCTVMRIIQREAREGNKHDVGETDQKYIVPLMLNISALLTSIATYKGRSLPLLVLADLRALALTNTLYHSVACDYLAMPTGVHK